MADRQDRREFLKRGVAAVGGAAAGAGLGASAVAGTSRPLPQNPRTPTAMPTRNLGRTGYSVGTFSLGGQASVELPNNEAQAVAIVEKALDLGVNYIDTAARYGGDTPWSQTYIGQVMKRRRGEAFLATKTHDRTRDGSMKLLEQSLKLLQTDHLDLWQIHNLQTMEQVDEIFRPDGAVKALQEAKEQGIARHIGVTGHADPVVLIEAISRAPFDTILLAVNAADPHHLSFQQKLLPLAVEKEMGIIGMKIPSRGRLLAGWTPPPEGDRSRRPTDKGPGTLKMQEALRYVLSLPVSTVIVGCDSVAQVEEDVRFAREFNPLSGAQMAALEEKAKPVHQQALFFRRWT
ncbi:MAG TPA: aldo/keto reductase [Vicinamibacteria bacterium]|nr:aldo/keto reductase [Vicinamibacteria bacterium]